MDKLSIFCHNFDAYSEGMGRWLSVESGWFFYFPIYVILTVVVVMAIFIIHLLIFDEYAEVYENGTLPDTQGKDEL